MAAPSISIALCTRNGARFLEAQLASLARQSALPDELVVGDDASDDATLEIVARFAREAPFPMRTIARREAVGHRENFLATARECRGEWIAFADQDDVWLEHKLAESRAVIAAHPQVLLVNQRALLCDEALSPRSEAPFPPDRRAGLHHRPHRRLPLVWPGFLMTVHARLLRDFDPALRPRLGDGSPIGHGRWSFLLAAALGSYFVTAAPAALYRRHPETLTGEYRDAPRRLGGLTARSHQAVDAERDYAAAAAAALGRLAEVAAPEDMLHLRAAAADYAEAGDALARRCRCYSGALASRLGAWLSAARRGAYVGSPLYAGGFRAGAKDAAAALGL